MTSEFNFAEPAGSQEGSIFNLEDPATGLICRLPVRTLEAAQKLAQMAADDFTAAQQEKETAVSAETLQEALAFLKQEVLQEMEWEEATRQSEAEELLALYQQKAMLMHCGIQLLKAKQSPYFARYAHAEAGFARFAEQIEEDSLQDALDTMAEIYAAFGTAWDFALARSLELYGGEVDAASQILNGSQERLALVNLFALILGERVLLSSALPAPAEPAA